MGGEPPDAPFEFVTEGVAAALPAPGAAAQDRRGDGRDDRGPALQLGLLDVVAIDLVPVVMGGGRPFFPGLPFEDVPLGDPDVCVPSDRVIHLRMPVLRPDPD